MPLAVQEGTGVSERRRGWIRLGEADNVVVLTHGVESGDVLRGPQDEHWTIDTRLTVGHKLAARAIADGETVFKGGVPIGVATRSIASGEHVHSHNLRSRFIQAGGGGSG